MNGDIFLHSLLDKRKKNFFLGGGSCLVPATGQMDAAVSQQMHTLPPSPFLKTWASSPIRWDKLAADARCYACFNGRDCPALEHADLHETSTAVPDI